MILLVVVLAALVVGFAFLVAGHKPAPSLEHTMTAVPSLIGVG